MHVYHPTQYIMVSLRVLALAVVALSCCCSAEDGISSGMRVMYSVYKQCEEAQDPVICLKARAVKLVDRALHAEAIPIVDGISLTKRPETERSLKAELEPLPADLESRSSKVDDLLWNRVDAFLQSHSVQFNMPSFINDVMYENEDGEEGRGKRKRLIPIILLGALLKGSMLALAMKGLALLAAKALLVSKLALVLAGIIALKKLFSSGGEKTTYEIVKQPIVSHSHEYSSSHEGYGGHEGYGRSLDAEVPHRLAYRAYKQQQQQQNTP
ncbi:hypothetical protein GE061_014622 [Apolygus lucorum]|uniref:Osiris 9 n=1 Tax=Apolygus lucorum TaxID=248454 RepID=A0A8S9XIJ5_APOLU|nr:hypothetical protein GE061_014622 [Apolygus lucorum]